MSATGRLEGLRALVTGGGTGIGAAIVARLAAEGAHVTAVGRRVEPLRASGAAAVCAADVTSPDDRRRAFEVAAPVDILVNNAGTGDGPWERLLDVNLTAAHRLSELAAESLAERGGCIVNVASVAALVATPGNPAYSVSKAGMVMLTRSQAVRLGPRGVRSNVVCPGWVRTPMADAGMAALAGDLDAAYAVATAHVPLGRPGTPAEVAAAVAFLASPDAAYVNGAVLTIDGGATAVDVGMLAFNRSAG